MNKPQMSNRSARKFLPQGDNHPPKSRDGLVFVGTWIPAEQHRILKQAAKDNRRSLCGQVAYELGQKYAQG